MDRIILSSKDVETLLTWRDNNADLVRRNAAPFKGILLEFPETKISIKAYNNAGNIAFYIHINGSKAGKITGQQLPGGLFKAGKNTTKLKSDDVQSIITVYASLMALIVYHEPEPAAAAASQPRQQLQERPKKAKTGAQRSKKGITYIFNHGSSGPRIQQRGKHASPSGVFSVRGHYRHYKDGRAVWIRPYKKGTGGQKNKTYKLN
jgi:hypothetical protein